MCLTATQAEFIDGFARRRDDGGYCKPSHSTQPRNPITMATKSNEKPAAKPLKSRFFRVATEGATTDGRAITREQIDQMAKNFDPAKYGARV